MPKPYTSDMISIKGIYSQEANEELDKLIKTPITLLDGSGNPTRDGTGKESILSMFSLTM
jgi:hypothetical protein